MPYTPYSNKQKKFKKSALHFDFSQMNIMIKYHGQELSLGSSSREMYPILSVQSKLVLLTHALHLHMYDIFNFVQMGLGKTAQSIAVMEYQRQILGTRGPFLVIAPLTTLGHWQREIETWTTMVRDSEASYS